MKKSLKMSDNRGFTLVELVVSMLVSSLVILGATMFLSVTLNSYNFSNTEASLQMESQIALNLIENLVIEAKECKYDASYQYGADAADSCVLYKIATTDESGADIIYLIMLNSANSQLLLKKVAASSTDEEIKAVVSSAVTATKPALLSNFVTNLRVTPANIDTDSTGLVRIDIDLEYNSKTYTSSTSISLRNGVHR